MNSNLIGILQRRNLRISPFIINKTYKYNRRAYECKIER